MISDAVVAALDGDGRALALELSGAEATRLARAVNSAVFACSQVDPQGIEECLVERVSARKVGVYLAVLDAAVLRLFVGALEAVLGEVGLASAKLDVQRSSMTAFWDDERPAIGVVLSDGSRRPAERPGGKLEDPFYGGSQPSWMRSAIDVLRGVLPEISGSQRVQMFIRPDYRKKAFPVTLDTVYAELDVRAVKDPGGTVQVLLECGGRTAMVKSGIVGITASVDLDGSDTEDVVEVVARRLEVLPSLVDSPTEYSAMFVVPRRVGIGYDRYLPGYEDSLDASTGFVRDGVGWTCWVQWIDEGLAARLGPPAKIGPTDRTLTRLQLGELAEWLDFERRDALLDVVEAVIEPARLTTEFVHRRYREMEALNNQGNQ